MTDLGSYPHTDQGRATGGPSFRVDPARGNPHRGQLGEGASGAAVPQPRFLTPAPVLYAHLVTTRNGQDETRFDAEIARQLGELGVRGDVKRGRRRAFTVKDKRVVAHSLRVVGLSDEDSIHLQEQGLGGRRKLGCGIFVPAD